AVKSNSWAESLKRNDWTPAWLAGDDFTKFVAADFASMKDTMTRAGMVS
ncbi:MAG: tripartite tricarboxylate transporter substrate binding protein, partial [Comamonas sp.]